MRDALIEKIKKTGVKSLSQKDLLTVITGSRDEKRFRKILSIAESQDRDSMLPKSKIDAAFLCSAELIRRTKSEMSRKITCTSDVIPYISEYASKKQEHFLTVTLNGANEIIKTRVVTIGLANRTQIHPREIFSDAITDRACSIIAAHNHPSGSLVPSDEDILITEKLKNAGELIGIELLDHIIFAETGHASVLGWM